MSKIGDFRKEFTRMYNSVPNVNMLDYHIEDLKHNYNKLHKAVMFMRDSVNEAIDHVDASIQTKEEQYKSESSDKLNDILEDLTELMSEFDEVFDGGELQRIEGLTQST